MLDKVSRNNLRKSGNTGNNFKKSHVKHFDHGIVGENIFPWTSKWKGTFRIFGKLGNNLCEKSQKTIMITKSFKMVKAMNGEEKFWDKGWFYSESLVSFTTVLIILQNKLFSCTWILKLCHFKGLKSWNLRT